MPKKPQKKRPADMNQLAKSIVESATSDEPEPEESAKVIAGRKGGKKGGDSRASKLTAKQRSDIARKAARDRWQKHRNKDQGSDVTSN